MLHNPVHDWLLTLCDPCGAGSLPTRRLDAVCLEQLLAAAWDHGVAGAVAANLKSLLADSAPVLSPIASSEQVRALLEGVQARWMQFRAVAIFLRQRALELRKQLAAAGIETVVLKGEDYSARLYPRPGLRPYRDIDLIIAPHEIAPAGRLLADLGFEPIEAEDEKYDDGYGQDVWVRTELGMRIIVELHWNLINSPAQRRHSSITLVDLQLETVSIDGGEDQRCTPAAQLLVAAVHAVHGHRFDRLQHLCDIRQACRETAGPLDLGWLRQAARKTGTVSSLAMALEVTGRLLRDADCRRLQAELGLIGRGMSSRLLVSKSTLLDPYSRLSTLKRQVVREIVKRAA